MKKSDLQRGPVSAPQILQIDQNIAFGFSALILAMMTLVLFTGIFYYQRIVQKNENHLQKIITEILADSINRISFSGKYHARLLVEKITKAQPRISYISISDTTGRIIAHSNTSMNGKKVTPKIAKLFKEVSRKKRVIIQSSKRDGKPINQLATLYYSGYQSKINGLIVVGISTEEADAAITGAWYVLCAIVFFLSLISLVVTYFLGKHFAGPVKSMALQLKGILEHAPLLIYISDRNAGKTASSLSFEAMAQQTPDLLSSELAEVFEQNKPVTGEVNQSERTFVTTSFPISQNARQEIQLACSMALDVTARKQAEERLRDSEANLQITLDSIGDAVIATDSKGCVHRMNTVAEILTGWLAKDAIGQDLETVMRITDLDTRQKLPNPIFEVMRIGYVISFSERCLLSSKSGKERQIASKGSPIRDAEDNIVGVVLVFRDVTEEYALQEQLRQAHKMRAIGHLAGGVAHDFNNLLTAILGNAELLKFNQEPGSEDEMAAESIVQASTRAAELTHQLLAFSRKGKLQSVPVDLNKIISQEIIGLLSRSIDKRISITQKLNASASIVQGDPTDLQNAILNLGVNARDAMPEGGTLTFATNNLILDVDYSAEFAYEILPGEYIEIVVSDTGVGMSPEVQKHIFEPFYTTKPVGEGTGLGLSGVFGCVKSHNGLIRVQSEVGRGSTFRVLLPLSKAKPDEQEVLEDLPPQQGTGHIMIVDDEETVRTLAARTLQGLGYTVTTCADGIEAISYYQHHYDEVDLVILDLIMPKLGGLETLLRLKKTNPSVKVLVASGYAQPSVVAAVLKEGALEVLNKPYRIGLFSEAVARHLANTKHNTELN